jgi:hypothetical protein
VAGVVAVIWAGTVAVGAAVGELKKPGYRWVRRSPEQPRYSQSEAASVGGLFHFHSRCARDVTGSASDSR